MCAPNQLATTRFGEGQLLLNAIVVQWAKHADLCANALTRHCCRSDGENPNQGSLSCDKRNLIPRSLDTLHNLDVVNVQP